MEKIVETRCHIQTEHCMCNMTRHISRVCLGKLSTKRQNLPSHDDDDKRRPSLCLATTFRASFFISEEEAVVLSSDLSEVRSLPGKRSKAGLCGLHFLPSRKPAEGGAAKLPCPEAFRSVLTPSQV